MLLERLRPGGIAVVDMQGAIGPQLRPLDYARLLTKLREDNSVQGVVLNIDSPGGSAGGSEMVTRAVRRLREQKPVAAFIGNVGASGGYMIASAAERIVALPSSIVGSIGVIAYRPLVYEALGRIGVRMDVGKAGRLKDMLSPFREPTEEEKQKEQNLLDTMYSLFVSSVARARGLPEERVRELATGEVWVGTQALDARLIDGIGDLDDAIDWVVARSGASRRLRVMRPRRGLREMLLNRGLASMFGLSADGGLAGRWPPMLSLAAEGGILYLYTGPGGWR